MIQSIGMCGEKRYYETLYCDHCHQKEHYHYCYQRPHYHYEKKHYHCNSIYDARSFCRKSQGYDNSKVGNYYYGYRDTYLMDLLNSDRGGVKQV
jgi:hypothetical protein